MRFMTTMLAVAMAGMWLVACGTGEVIEAAADTAAAVSEAGGEAAVTAALDAVEDCADVAEECCEAEVAPEGCPDCGEVDCCCGKDKKTAAAAEIPADKAAEYAKALEECGGCTHCAHAKLGIDMGSADKGDCPHAGEGKVHAAHGDGDCPHAGKDKKDGEDCGCGGHDKAGADKPAKDVPVQG